MVRKSNEMGLFRRILNAFKKPSLISKGDIGIYEYIWTCSTESNTNIFAGLKYDIFIKIKVVDIYPDLIEIDVISIKISDSASQDIMNVIKNNTPKFINPKHVRWEILSEEDEKK